MKLEKKKMSMYGQQRLVRANEASTLTEWMLNS
jgi:hypothetical protein